MTIIRKLRDPESAVFDYHGSKFCLVKMRNWDKLVLSLKVITSEDRNKWAWAGWIAEKVIGNIEKKELLKKKTITSRKLIVIWDKLWCNDTNKVSISRVSAQWVNSSLIWTQQIYPSSTQIGWVDPSSKLDSFATGLDLNPPLTTFLAKWNAKCLRLVFLSYKGLWQNVVLMKLFMVTWLCEIIRL